MREARLVGQPVFPPGACFGCGGVEGPLVDTMIDIIGEGRIYVCTRVCLPAWAGLAGYATPETLAELADRLDKAVATVAELEEELAYERDHKIVALSDMLALADRRDVASEVRQQARGDVLIDAVATKLAEIPRGGGGHCTATKVDGKPCTANALPGRDVCLAHSKRTVAA